MTAMRSWVNERRRNAQAYSLLAWTGARAEALPAEERQLPFVILVPSAVNHFGQSSVGIRLILERSDVALW